MFDIYRDYFTRENLMASIAKAPYIPGRLAEYFESMPLSSTVLSLESSPTNGASILAGVPRGTPSKVETLERRSVYTFTTSHYRADGNVYADEVLNARAYGATGAAEIITQRRDMLMARMRRDIDLTHESLRMTVVKTATNAFGTIPGSQQIALNTDATKTRKEIFDKIIVPIESALDGIPSTGIVALCGDTFWGKLIENAAVKATLLNYSMAQSLRNDPRETVFFGGVQWERYRGTGTVIMTTGEARVFPVGVPQMWVQAFAPADVMDQVGAGMLGTPYYPQAIPSSDNRRWYLEIQTNCVMVCTRPTAVLTITTD
jgi:hypothetical protein